MPSQRAVRTLPKTAGGRKTALQNRGFTPRKEFSTMKREDVKNKIPGITDEQLDWLMAKTAGT